MATRRPFAYNTGAAIPGTSQVGSLAIGKPTNSYESTGLTWWGGPDEDKGYVIAYSQPDGQHPIPPSHTPGAYLGFKRTNGKTDTGFIALASQIAYGGSGQLFVSSQQAKTWLNSNGYWTSFPGIVTDGLIAYLDPSNTSSYIGSGTQVRDLSGQTADGTLNGQISFVSNAQASYFNFATANNSNFISSSLSQKYLDCTIVLMPDFTYSTPTGLAGLIANGSAAMNLDKSLRFTGVNGTGPWAMTGRNPGDANDWAYPSATTFYVNGASSNTLVSGWNFFGGYRTNQATFPLSFPYYIGSGNYSGDNRAFQGKIGLVLLYNRQLSAAEQLQNFTALRGRFGL